MTAEFSKHITWKNWIIVCHRHLIVSFLYVHIFGISSNFMALIIIYKLLISKFVSLVGTSSLNSKFVCPIAYWISPRRPNKYLKFSIFETKFLIFSSSPQISSFCRLPTINVNSVIQVLRPKKTFILSLTPFLTSTLYSTQFLFVVHWNKIRASLSTSITVTLGSISQYLAHCNRLHYGLPASDFVPSNLFCHTLTLKNTSLIISFFCSKYSSGFPSNSEQVTGSL